MPKVSSAAWIAHNLGLAAAIGGALFGKTALDPALRLIKNPEERDMVNQDAWRRYGVITMASHAAMAIPWIVGRTMLSGKEVSSEARTLTKTKDVLVAVSLASVAASAILGRLMAKRNASEPGPEQARAQGPKNGEEKKKVTMDYAVDTASMVNLAANVGIASVTTMLAMEGSQSVRFALKSARLP